MARFTVTDLRDRIAHFNECLAHGVSGFLFVDLPRNGMQAVDLHYVDEEGKLHNSGNAGGGTSRETYEEVYQSYQSIHGTVYHHCKVTRKMAKTMLSRSKTINFSKDVAQLSHSQLVVLAAWAKACKYRKSSTSPHSTGAAFFLHLQRKVIV